jgi:hypothetical protein
MKPPFHVEDEGEDVTLLHRSFHKEVAQLHRDTLPRDLPTELLDKCMRITSGFEGPDGYGTVSGNFDGEGASVGALQQCVGQGSLQPLLREMQQSHRAVLVNLWSEPITRDFETFLNMGKSDQVHWCSLQLGSRERPTSLWAERFRHMARSPEYIAIQQKYAMAIFVRAVALADSFQLVQENAVALMFDVVTQNGSIKAEHRSKILELAKNRGSKLGRVLTEDEMLECISIGRASFSKAQWQADVASRKLCISRRRTAPFSLNGKDYSGKVHGDSFDLAKQFSLTNKPYKKT